MQAVQGSLVIVGANTQDAKVFWNGAEVDNVGFKITNKDGKQSVTLFVKENPLYAELRAAGITVKETA